MIALVLIAVFAAGLAAGVALTRRHRPKAAVTPGGGGRILFPFVGGALSKRALQASLRIARAEGAVLVPAYVVTVPMTLPLDVPLPNACGTGFELLEAIEQRAASAGVPADARIGRGRTVRHALRHLMDTERFDRIVIAAGDEGFSAEDVAWLLRQAQGEVVVVRPADDRFLRAGPAEPDYASGRSGYTSSMLLSGSNGAPAAA